MFKSTILLAIALFLITAPAPDAADIAEATHGLMADNGAATLQAAEAPAACREPVQATSAEHPSTDRCADQRTAP